MIIVRPILLVLLIVFVVVFLSSLYAFVFDDRARNIVVAGFSLSSLLGSLFLWSLLRRLETVRLSGNLCRSGSVLEKILLPDSIHVKITFENVVDGKRFDRSYVAYALPVVLCVVASYVLSKFPESAGLLEWLSTIWRSYYVEFFSFYHDEVSAFNAMLFVVALPQALMVSRLSSASQGLHDPFSISGRKYSPASGKDACHLAKSLIVVFIVGFMYQFSSATRFLGSFSSAVDFLESIGLFGVYIVGLIGHVLFVFFLSKWISLRRAMLVKN